AGAETAERLLDRIADADLEHHAALEHEKDRFVAAVARALAVDRVARLHRTQPRHLGEPHGLFESELAQRRALVEETRELLAGIEDQVPDDLGLLRSGAIERDAGQHELLDRLVALPAAERVEGERAIRESDDDAPDRFEGEGRGRRQAGATDAEVPGASEQGAA